MLATTRFNVLSRPLAMYDNLKLQVHNSLDDEGGEVVSFIQKASHVIFGGAALEEAAQQKRCKALKSNSCGSLFQL